MVESSVVVLPSVKTTHIGVVLGLAMGPAVALGLGRFAYALLLPAMRADLGWSYAVAGAMNTANAIGYLIGALGRRRSLYALATSEHFSPASY